MQNNHDGFSNVGSALTESNGEFTFPTTGIYLITYNFQAVSTFSIKYIGAHLQVTKNGSTYSIAATAHESMHDHPSNTNAYAHCAGTFIFHVVDTETHRFRFVCQSSAPVTFLGQTGENYSEVTVVQLS